MHWCDPPYGSIAWHHASIYGGVCKNNGAYHASTHEFKISHTVKCLYILMLCCQFGGNVKSLFKISWYPWYMRLSHRPLRNLLASEGWRRVVWYNSTDVSEKHAACLLPNRREVPQEGRNKLALRDANGQDIISGHSQCPLNTYSHHLLCANQDGSWLSRYSDSLEVGRPGTRPDRPWDHPSLLYSEYRAFITVQRPKPGVDSLPHPTSSSSSFIGVTTHYGF